MGGAPRVRRGQPQTAADRAADRRAPRRGSPRSTVVCDGYVWRRSAEGVAEGRRGTAAERRGTAAVPPRSFAERRGASHRGGPRFPPRFCDGTAALWRRFGDALATVCGAFGDAWRGSPPTVADRRADRRGPPRYRRGRDARASPSVAKYRENLRGCSACRCLRGELTWHRLHICAQPTQKERI